MLDFTKLWNKIYLFGPNPPDLSRSDLIFFWVSLVFIVAAIISKIMVFRTAPGSPKRMLRSRVFHLFLTIGILVLLWVGARFENIPWLSVHIVVLSLFLIGLVWLVYIGRYYIREFKTKERQWREDQIKQKYLR